MSAIECKTASGRILKLTPLMGTETKFQNVSGGYLYGIKSRTTPLPLERIQEIAKLLQDDFFVGEEKQQDVQDGLRVFRYNNNISFCDGLKTWLYKSVFL